MHEGGVKSMRPGDQRQGERDFPFYAATPGALSLRGWLIAGLGCLVGFIALFGLPQMAPGAGGRLAGALAFVAAPLIGLSIASGGHARSLFPGPRAKDLLIGLAFAPVSLAVAALAAVLIVQDLGAATANPVVSELGRMGALQEVLFFASTIPQLVGEELITVIPLLAVMALCVRKGADRRAALLAGWIVSAALFGVLHLSTYGWSLGQALGVIGVTRLVLTIPFLITKTLWSSTVTHIAHDWLTLGAAVWLINAGGEAA